MKSMLRDIRRRGCEVRRLLSDTVSGSRGRFAGVEKDEVAEARIALKQSITRSDHVEAKLHNMALAASAINGVRLRPDAIFSFWHMVGRPSAARGFLPGRSLLGGRLALDYGGGLCQMSGLLYHLALQSGLTVIERHPHTLDIYTEEERYTPLGSDAAVAYGFKDLRFVNTHRFPVDLRVDIAADSVAGFCCAPLPIPRRDIEFVRVRSAGGTSLVETWRSAPDGGRELIATSLYALKIDDNLR
ncbi:MAG: Vancomycin B-type resistance protein VanW [Chlorobi bacterium]|nr:Vancomycin B-type resistance protein VanW [Chlorobiota bacterium]